MSDIVCVHLWSFDFYFVGPSWISFCLKAGHRMWRLVGELIILEQVLFGSSEIW